MGKGRPKQRKNSTSSSSSNCPPPSVKAKRKLPSPEPSLQYSKNHCPKSACLQHSESLAISTDSLVSLDSAPDGVLSEEVVAETPAQQTQPNRESAVLVSRSIADESKAKNLHNSSSSMSVSQNSSYASVTQSSLSKRRSAQASLASSSLLAQLPDTTRVVHVQGSSPNTNIAKTNPFKIAKCIDQICGEVQEVQHLKSGGLYITCKNIDQVKILLSATSFTISSEISIPIKVAIALSNQTVSGKIYAP